MSDNTLYVLNPMIDVRAIGAQIFVVPRNHQNEMLHLFATHALSEPYGRTLMQFRKARSKRIKNPSKQVLKLIEAGYLIKSKPSVRGEPPKPKPDLKKKLGALHFTANSLFNSPAAVSLKGSDVAVLGLPVATFPICLGTQAAPMALRHLSRRYSWFDICEKGWGIDDPAGKNIIIKDMGDARIEGKTPSQVITFILKMILRIGRAKPLFLGGDHALTYLILAAMSRKYGSLGLIHFDAHDDAFYMKVTDFNHSNPIRNILETLPQVKQILSFGLRKSPRSQIAAAGWENKWVSYDVRQTKIVAKSSPKAFLKILEAVKGLPCYFTLDVDVISERELAAQTTTPKGAGLGFEELCRLIKLIGENTDLVGADVVEFRPNHDVKDSKVNRGLAKVLVYLIQALANNSK